MIALALVVLCFENATKPVKADGPTRVIVTGVDASVTMPVTLLGGTRYLTQRVDSDNPLAVVVVKP